MTRRFLLYLIRAFFDLLSLRGCRRNLVSHYSTTVLPTRGPHAAVYCISEVPRNGPLRAVLLRVLGDWWREKVRRLRSLVNVYSGSVIRGDGQWKIARRVVERSSSGSCGPRTRPWNVLLAWVGIDGAILDVPRLSKSESIEDCLKDIDRVDQDEFSSWSLRCCLPSTQTSVRYSVSFFFYCTAGSIPPWQRQWQ